MLVTGEKRELSQEEMDSTAAVEGSQSPRPLSLMAGEVAGQPAASSALQLLITVVVPR